MGDILTMVCIVSGFGVAFGIICAGSVAFANSKWGEKLLSSLTK